jgi:hypothetical protein
MSAIECGRIPDQILGQFKDRFEKPDFLLVAVKKCLWKMLLSI